MWCQKVTELKAGLLARRLRHFRDSFFSFYMHRNLFDTLRERKKGKKKIIIASTKSQSALCNINSIWCQTIISSSRNRTVGGIPLHRLNTRFCCRFLGCSRVHCWRKHLHLYCTATEQRLKRCQSEEGGLLHSSEIKALYRAEQAILLSLLHSSSAATACPLATVWRPFLSVISIYRTQEVLRRLRKGVAAPSATA